MMNRSETTGLSLNEKTVCNSALTVCAAYFKTSAEAQSFPTAVEVRVQCDMLAAETLVVLTKELSAKTIKKRCPFIRFHGAGAERAVDEYLLTTLQAGLRSGSIQTGYYFDQQGAIDLPDSRTMFLRGDALLGDCGRPYIVAPELRRTLLASNDAYGPQEMAMALMYAPPQVLLTLAFVLLTSVRSVVLNAGVGLQAVLYIVGGQGLGKTTLATRLAGIYRKPDTRLPACLFQAGSSSAALFDLLTSCRDMPVIVDDLCLSAGKETERKSRETGARLIREGSGQVPLTKKSGKQLIERSCEAGIILTAEFSLENMSDLTRCLIVPVDEQLQLSNELTPELSGSAVRQHSVWFTENGETAIARLMDMLQCEDDVGQDRRVFTNYTCLQWAFESFVCALLETGVSDRVGRKLLSRMEHALGMANEAHGKLIDSLLSKRPAGNLSFCILEGFRNDAFQLTKSIEKLCKREGIIWGKDLCLRPEALIRFVRTQAGYQDWTRNRITRALKDIGALCLQEEDSDTVHLQKSTDNVPVPRVYRIRLEVLDKTSEKY